MPELASSDILTKEVLDWEGLHLFHFSSSSCSQKTRIFIRLKGLDVTLHHIDLAKKENQSDWYMGINPRGLVPTLVDNGKVIIESNDILEYLDHLAPEPALIPPDRAEEVSRLLKFEDDLHMDLRALTMRYVLPSFMVMRKEEDLQKYMENGSGEVGGVADEAKDKEFKFWSEMRLNGGITDSQIRTSTQKFRTAFEDLDGRLTAHPYLLGDQLSVLDVAWYIYAQRLQIVGYDLEAEHANVAKWYHNLDARPEFASETKAPTPLRLITGMLHAVQALKGTSFSKVAMT